MASLLTVTEWFMQAPHGVRFDWGRAGAERLASRSACLVIVDVLSFTTSVTVAVEAGIRVFPYAWRDESAAVFAAERQAVLATGRRATSTDSPWSLSPAALRNAPFTARLVLPSPNGSAIAAAAAAGGSVVVASCLRNAAATGSWLADQGFGTEQRPVTVIAAGERWPDGSLRPALEDLLGAGAILAALQGEDAGRVLSAEAAAAGVCFEGTRDVVAAVCACASGRELTEGGFGEDVAIAAEVNACGVVPVLTDGAFSAA